MDLEAIAFDIDGTLYPNYIMYLNSMTFGLRNPHLLYHFSAIRKLIRTIRPIENFRYLQAELLAGRMNITTEVAYELIEHRIYHQWGQSFHRVRPFPFVKETIGGFHAAGMKLAVVSDFPVERKLVYLGLDFPWGCAFSSEETGYLKPNPEPFMEICSRLGVPPERILYVGNSYDYDIIGAKSVGMRTAHLTSRKIRNSLADITFTDFRQLQETVLGRVNS